MKRTVAIGGALALAGALSLAAGVSAQDPGHPAHPGHIHAGVCPAPGDVVIPLADAVAATDAAQGVSSAIPVRVSITNAEMPLADILAAEHSINYHESADTLDVYIACGDLGGPVMGGTDLAVGLADQNASGHSGVAWLHDNGDGTTTVYVFLVEGTATEAGASPAPAASPAADASPMAPAASPAADASPMAPAASPAADASPMAPAASPAAASPAPEASPAA